MAKQPATIFVCQSCGSQSRKWLGQCPDCSEWNTFVEERFRPTAQTGASNGVASIYPPSTPVQYGEIEAQDDDRTASGIDELDRVLGGGIVGINAAKMAAGMGAKVTILDLSLERLRYLSDVMPANCVLIYSNRHNILEQIETADLVVGAVLIPGAKAPKLVRREDLKIMQPGAVIVDVAIDQGGCVETIKATTHENPTYVVDGIIHYGVANMPGGVPRTSTLALTNATLPYAMQLANKGWKKALRDNPALLKGLNMAEGKVTYPGVAEAFGMQYDEPAKFVV